MPPTIHSIFTSPSESLLDEVRTDWNRDQETRKECGWTVVLESKGVRNSDIPENEIVFKI